MTSKARACTLLLTTALVCRWAAAQSDSWISDRELASDLTTNGIFIDTDLASLWFENGALDTQQMKAFADLVNRGVLDIAIYLGGSQAASRKIRFFISSEVQISHSTWHSVYLPLEKVRDRTAPYLHETTHVLAPCEDCPMWFSEGLASYVQSYVSEHTGGYDGGIFSHRGNRGIDQDARRWLASSRGQAVLPFIGVPGEPPEINYDRSNVAAPFYVMAQSFVKFIAERATLKKIQSVFEARDFDAELQRTTGKSAATWKEEWLADVGSAKRR